MTIAIVIPVYNSARYLHECIESVLAQTYVNWVCVCVNDGSTDESGKILDDFAARDRRISVVHKKNAGVWAARNAALEIARGEWLTFVDADDVLHPDYLQTYIDIAVRENADLVRLRSCYGKKMPSGFFVAKRCDDYESFEGSRAFAWMWNTMATEGFLWRCCIRRGLADGVQFPPINCKEDSLWLLELAPRVKKTVQGGFAGYFYRATEGSLMRQNRNVSQCCFYLKAMLSLWRRQQDAMLMSGCRLTVSKNIRASADNDIIEWAMKRAPVDDLPRRQLLLAYQDLEGSGALDAPYSNRKRYLFGFWWWRQTGQIWAIRFPGLFFLYLRGIINWIRQAN